MIQWKNAPRDFELREWRSYGQWLRDYHLPDTRINKQFWSAAMDRFLAKERDWEIERRLIALEKKNGLA